MGTEAPETEDPTRKGAPMKKTLLAALAAALLSTAALAEEWKVPMTGVPFPVQKDGMTLLGGGVRVKKILFTFKVYAIAFYVSDEALAGPLAVYKGKTTSPAFYHELQTGDFKKEVVLRFMRNLSESRIQEGMRESLAGADPKILDQFISYFPQVKDGEVCELRYLPGGTLESEMAGQAKPPIHDKKFADQLFGLYVGPSPLQTDIKEGVVVRAAQVLK
jgi:hypothetical protein